MCCRLLEENELDFHTIIVLSSNLQHITTTNTTYSLLWATHMENNPV